MKRKLVTILIGCMTLGLFGCGSGLSDTTKRLRVEDDSSETIFGYRDRQCALNLRKQTY